MVESLCYGDLNTNCFNMSYKPIPFTYGVRTLTEINALTGMQEGDTVYNSTWQIIEIYSGTNWINSQSFEAVTTSAVVIPPTGTIPSGDRSGSAFPNDGGYAIEQTSNNSAQLSAVGGNDNYYLGTKIRGTSSSGSTSRIVIAHCGKWPMFVGTTTVDGSTATIGKGNFIETPRSTYGTTGFFSNGGTAGEDQDVGTFLEAGSSSSDSYRNYLCVVQTVENS